MTPLSHPGCPLGPCMSRFRKCILGFCSIFIPGGPVGRPVARSDVVLWAPRLEIGRGTRPAQAEPTAASVSPKLVRCKSLSECCAARAGPGQVPNVYILSDFGNSVVQKKGFSSCKLTVQRSTRPESNIEHGAPPLTLSPHSDAAALCTGTGRHDHQVSTITLPHSHTLIFLRLRRRSAR